MVITNISDAKASLSTLIEMVMQGQEVIIGKAGKPVAKIVPHDENTRPRHGQPGRSKLVAWPDIAIVQVVKHRTAAGLDVVRRICSNTSDQLLTRPK